jgi:hypothetical protein
MLFHCNRLELIECGVFGFVVDDYLHTCQHSILMACEGAEKGCLEKVCLSSMLL